MSSKNNNPSVSKREENKNEFPKNIEKENCFLEDIKLLSSLKSIPGKIIPLYNQINEMPKCNNKDNNNDKKNITDSNMKFYQVSKNIFSPIDKTNINGINLINNNINNNIINNVNKYTTNNFYFNNGINNTNININPLNNQNWGMTPFPDYGGFIKNQLMYSPSNHPSFLSIKSEMKNNSLWTDNKFTQNSFYYPNKILFNRNYINQNENNLNKGNFNKIINNKFSQLSFQQYNNNINNEELLKKKRSSASLLNRKESESNFDNINNIDNNSDEKICMINYKNDENFKKENTEEKDNKPKKEKILFNIENYYEEEDDDNIYHNIKNDLSNKNKLFNCIHKKKKRKKNEIKKYKCVHTNCEYSYKTKKQLLNHHYKMIPECQLDSVQILKFIYKTKLILINLIKDNKSKRTFFTKLYEENINNISLTNYIEFITGSHFDDIV